MKKYLRLIFFFILIMLFACTSPQDFSLTEIDKDYFENFWPNIEKAWNEGDREPYIRGHENAMYMVPNGKTLSTPSDIRAFVESFPEGKANFSNFDIRGNQGLVGVKGDFQASNPDGTILDKGKFLALFEKNTTGKWEMTHAIWNSDLPIAKTNIEEEIESGLDN